MNYEGQVAIVTGAASGIGRALAKRLATAGAMVVVSDVDEEGAAAVAESINARSNSRAEAVGADVTDAATVSGLVEGTLSNHGRLDFMFNNAGIAVTGEVRDLDVTHWQRVIDVNLMGVVYGSNAAYKVMAKQGFGHIVNIASLAGLLPFPTNVPYSATKHAVVGLSTSLRAEGQDLGVRVSVVCPGFIDSNIYTASEVVNVSQEALLKSIPYKKVPTDAAARKILQGVERNKEIIVFPGYARFFWWLYRFNLRSTRALAKQTIRNFRKIRDS